MTIERKKLAEFHYTSYDDGAWEVHDEYKGGNCDAKGRNEKPVFAASLTQFFLNRFLVQPRFPIIIEHQYTITKRCWLRFKKVKGICTETCRLFNMKDLKEFIDNYYREGDRYSIFDDSSFQMNDLIELVKSISCNEEKIEKKEQS